MTFLNFILYINNNYYNYNYNKHYYFYYFFFYLFHFQRNSVAHDIEELADPEYGAADEIDELTPIIFYLFHLNFGLSTI